MKLVPTIGLEVHVQLKTRTKIFCGCPNSFGAAPNSLVCPVCLGMPGVLPVLNRQVLALGIRVALGLNSTVAPRVVFHRKNYFYPDLPKGYQISQFDLPLGSGGTVEVGEQKVRIHRAHLEEDAGKLIHKPDDPASLVDLNRAGVPLMEIVSEPDIDSPEEAYDYLKTLKAILQYLEVSDCDMEKGSLRCDANVSVRPEGTETLGTKVEIKNLNSFRAVAKALEFEIQRQSEAVEIGEKIVQETRLWDENRLVTRGMRGKEFAHDYRYFPEPDLMPLTVTDAQIQSIRETLPELPRQRAGRLIQSHGLSEKEAAALTATKGTADYFEACAARMKGPEGVKKAANWMLGELAKAVNEGNLDSVDQLGFPTEHLAELITLVDSGKISGKMAKSVFASALKEKTAPSKVVEAQGMRQVTDKGAIETAAREVIAEHAKPAADFKGGKDGAMMFLVGQVMRKTQGAASPEVVQQVFRALLRGE